MIIYHGGYCAMPGARVTVTSFRFRKNRERETKRKRCTANPQYARVSAISLERDDVRPYCRY